MLDTFYLTGSLVQKCEKKNYYNDQLKNRKSRIAHSSCRSVLWLIAAVG